ncbi:hypothetical protein JYU34_000226 [Plutella xylostella]|uniref:Uncharacterized protein n=1 Tax=Plutella xylostella TaxID=51655 RepID=A0ABQ7R756_PLUXY|nr:hypothetical protein JYU34_000226 [Plutella xylostella]
MTRCRGSGPRWRLALLRSARRGAAPPGGPARRSGCARWAGCARRRARARRCRPCCGRSCAPPPCACAARPPRCPPPATWAPSSTRSLI